MEGNVYRTNGLDCFTNGSLDLLADEYIFPPFSLLFSALFALLPSGICHFRSSALPSQTGGMQFGQTDFAIRMDRPWPALSGSKGQTAFSRVHHTSTRVHALTTCPKAHNAFPFRILYRSSLFRISSASSFRIEAFTDFPTYLSHPLYPF